MGGSRNRAAGEKAVKAVKAVRVRVGWGREHAAFRKAVEIGGLVRRLEDAPTRLVKGRDAPAPAPTDIALPDRSSAPHARRINATHVKEPP